MKNLWRPESTRGTWIDTGPCVSSTLRNSSLACFSGLSKLISSETTFLSTKGSISFHSSLLPPVLSNIYWESTLGQNTSYIIQTAKYYHLNVFSFLTPTSNQQWPPMNITAKISLQFGPVQAFITAHLLLVIIATAQQQRQQLLLQVLTGGAYHGASFALCI